MASVTLTVMQCDNPQCSVSREDSDAEAALGIYIDSGVIHNAWGGGPVAKVYACSEDCLGPAFSEVFRECWDFGQPRETW